jgi:hypothetical protein
LYYKPFVKPGMRAGDIYMATFYPAAMGKSDSHVIANAGNKIYDQNKILDVNKDKQLTVGDVKKSVSAFV